ncbi:MAG: alpha/beta hydrolase-fold protein [Pseudomonadota bacterium]
MDIENYTRLGLDKSFMEMPFDTQINGRSNMELMEALNVPEDAQYNPCAEAYSGQDVPRGNILKIQNWDQTEIYAGTQREIWIYTPQQLQPNSSPALMVFNDGLGYADPAGPVRATAVLDNLIHASDLAPTVGLFVMPGVPENAGDDPMAGMPQRSFEYDSVTGTYVQFLMEELIPFAEQEIKQSFNPDPAHRTIVGISSGGICAFNAAWHNPQVFGRVLSHCGSFTNIRGGHNYPYLVRANTRRPIRVLLQSGERDGNIIMGNWPLANKEMASALDYAGYEYKFVFGEGGHSLRHGGAIFADSLRWLHQV